jgi:3-dehydroquinate synthase
MKINNIVIITDNAVKKYYVNKLLKILEKQGHSVLVLSFPSGEKSKNIYTVIKLQEAMLKNYCTRDVLILAVGGGVVGDVAGFVAATYLRGVSYIQIPTTLLAMVDSSIGGKTGINMSHGKNLMGAFHQPEMIIANINYLKTLPTKQIINGLVEVLKAFLIQDSKGFDYLNQNLTKVLEYDESVLLHIIKRAAKIKLNIIEIDPLEAGLRSVLNLGHTIGHALEKIKDYKILHGYAVAYGILLEAKVSQLMGILDQSSYQKIKVFLKALGFDGKKLRKFDVNKIIQATRSDKKAKLNNVNYVLLKNIGKVYQHKKNYVHAVPDKIVKQAYIAVIEE